MVHGNYIKRIFAVLLSSTLVFSSVPMNFANAENAGQQPSSQSESLRGSKFERHVNVGYASFEIENEIGWVMYDSAKTKMKAKVGNVNKIYATRLKDEQMFWKVRRSNSDNKNNLYYYFLLNGIGAEDAGDVLYLSLYDGDGNEKKFTVAKIGMSDSGKYVYCYAEAVESEEKFADCLKSAVKANIGSESRSVFSDMICGFSKWSSVSQPSFIINGDFKVNTEDIYIPVEMSEQDKESDIAVRYALKSDSVSHIPVMTKVSEKSPLVFKVSSDSYDGCFTEDTLKLSLEFPSDMELLFGKVKYYLVGESGEKKEVSPVYYVSDTKDLKFGFESAGGILSGELDVTGIKDGSPVISDCKASVKDGSLNVKPIGIWADNALQITVNVSDPGDKAFDKVKINGTEAEHISGDTYGVTFEGGYNEKNINVVLEKKGTAVKTQTITAVNGVSMNEEYSIFVSADLPKVSAVSEGEETELSDTLDFGVGKNFEIPLKVSSPDGIAEMSVKVYREGSTQEETLITCNGSSVQYSDKVSGIVLSKDTSVAYDSGVTAEDECVLKINPKGTKTLLADGTYYAEIAVKSHSGVSSNGKVKFSVDNTAPVVSVSFRNTSKINPVDVSYSGKEYKVYNNFVKVVLRASEPVEVTADAYVGGNQPYVSDNIFTSWTKQSDGTFISEWDFREEGLYAVKNFVFKDEAGNSSRDKNVYRFGVDKNEAEAEIKYDQNLTDELVKLLTFGFYKNDTITVNISLKDKVAGIAESDIKVINSEDNSDITKMFAISSPDGGRTYKLTGTLEKDTAYKIKVSVSDRLHRTESKVFGSGDFEVAYTDDAPEIILADDSLKWYNKDFQIPFTVKSDRDGKAANSGLRNLKISVYYKSSATEEKPTLIATLSDDGKNITGADGFTLARKDNKNVDFSKTKVESCEYRLEVSRDAGKGNIKSGYYAVVITAENNILLSDKKSYKSASAETDFGLDFESTDFSVSVTGDENTNTCVSNSSKVYDGKAEFTVKFRDITFENMNAESVEQYMAKNFKYDFKNSQGKTISKYKFSKWELAEGTADTYTSVLTISEEGFYSFEPKTFTNSSGTVTNLGVYGMKFAVDNKEANIRIRYSSNISEKMLSLLTFGLYRSGKMSVTVNVVDNIAGVDKDSIQVVNIAGETEENITSLFDFKENTAKNGYVGHLDFSQDEAYYLKVTANDMLRRNEPKNMVEEFPAIPDKADYELAYTKDSPSVTIINDNNYWFNKNAVLKINALADSDSEGANAGLRKLNVDMYYKSSNAGEWKLIGSVSDDGNKIRNTAGITLKRVNNTDSNFAETKIESCDYTLTVSKNETIVSGYYKAVVKAENNVLAPGRDDEYNSRTADIYFGLDFDKPEFSLNISKDENTNTCTAKESTVYDNQAVFTVTLKDVTFDSMKPEAVEDYISNPNNFKYSFKNSKGSVVEKYRFSEWSKVEGTTDTYTSTVVADEEDFYTLALVSFKNSAGTVVNLKDKSVKFAIDKNEANARVRFTKNVSEKLLGILTFGLYRNDNIAVTVNVVDKIAGVEKDSIKVFNTAGGSEEDITSQFDFRLNTDSSGYMASVYLEKDKAYRLKVTAYDRLNRNNPKNTVEEFPEIPGTDYEVAYTEDRPSVKVTGAEDSLWYNRDVVLNISALADSGSKGVNAGLRKVNVDMYYKPSNDGEWKLIGSVGDDGKTIRNTDGITLKRVTNADKNFAQTKIESCDYTLTISRNKTIVSGYYKAVATVENNVLAHGKDSEYNSQVSSEEFGLSFEDTEFSVNVAGNENTNTCISRSSVVYDGKAEFTVQLRDVTFENMNAGSVSKYMSEHFRYAFKNSRGQDISKYKFSKWKLVPGTKDTYSSVFTVSEEGFYSFEPLTFENSAGTVTDLKDYSINFAVDRNEANVRIRYSKNVSEEVLSLLTFGLYRSEEISVIVNTVDSVAGVEKDSIKVVNTADGRQEDITSMFTFEDNLAKNGYMCTVQLPKDKAYHLKVTVNDRLNRSNPKNTVEEFPVISDDDGYEVAYTEDSPFVTVGKVNNSYWSNSDVVLNIGALADKDAEGVNAGLHKLNVDMYYKPSNAGEWKLIGSVGDDGKEIRNTDGITLERTSNPDKNFAETKVESCNYTVRISKNETIVSGYYKAVVTVENNVLLKNSNDSYKQYQASEEFGLSFEKSGFSVNVSGADNTNTCMVEQSTVYDNEARFTVTLRDITFDYMEPGAVNSYISDPNNFKYSFKNSDNEVMEEYRFSNWKPVEGTTDTYTSTVTVTEEGFYTLDFVSFKNSAGTVVNIAGESKKFAVDKKEANVRIRFSTEVTEELLSILTFGLYRNNEIMVYVNVIDKTAGVQKDSIKVINTAGGSEEDITDKFDFQPNPDSNGYIAQMSLEKDKAYRLRVTANDRLERNNPKNSVQEFPVIPDNTDYPDYEVVYTEDEPVVTLGKGEAYWYDGDAVLNIHAVADSGSAGADAGLHKVNVDIEYKPSADTTGWVRIANVSDDGKDIQNTDGVTLARVNNADSDFSKTKVESCDYTVTVSHKGNETKILSGYYRAVVTVENNVLAQDETSKYHSAQSKLAFGLDFDAPEISVAFDNNEIKSTVEGTNYYDSVRTITVTVKEVSFDLEGLQNRKYFGDYSIVNESGESCDLVWNVDKASKNVFIGTYTFEDSAEDENDGAYTLNIPKFGDVLEHGAVTKAEGTVSEFEGVGETFVVDTTVPVIDYVYDNTNVFKYAGNDYYDKTRTLTVTVKEHNFALKDLEDSQYFDYSITDEHGDKHTLEWRQNDEDNNVFIGTYTFKDTSDENDGRFEVKINSLHDKSKNSAVTASDNTKFSGYSETFIIDTTAPIITYSYNNNKKTTDGGVDYYDAERTLTVRIVEHNISLEDLENNAILVYSITDEHGNSRNLNWSQDGNVFTGTFTFTDSKADADDGKFDVKIESLQDRAANKAKESNNFEFKGYAESFVIDTTAPVITYSYDNNNKTEDNNMDYYNAQRTLTVKVREHNFSLEDIRSKKYLNYSIVDEHGNQQTLEWKADSKDQNLFIGTYTFKDLEEDENDGAYSVNIVSLADKAKNSSVSDARGTKFESYSESFVIDTTAPVITYSYDYNDKNTVGGMDYYAKQRTLTISITEHNFQNSAELEEKFKYLIQDEHGAVSKLGWKKSGNTYTASFVFKDNADDPSDGLYNAELKAFTDKAKNSAVNNGKVLGNVQNQFVIDTTKPVVNVAYSDLGSFNRTYKNTDYYRTNALVVTITVTEHNFNYSNVLKYQLLDRYGVRSGAEQQISRNASEWSKSGENTYVAKYTLAGNSRYEYVGYSITDNANNNVTVDRHKQSFVIDNTPPVKLRVKYQQNAIAKLVETLTFGCYRADVGVVVSAEDSMAGISSLTYECVGMSGSRSVALTTKDFAQLGQVSEYNEFEFAIGPQFKGYIKMTATDLCGNVSSYSTADDKQGVLVDSNPPTIDVIAPVVKISPAKKPRNNIFDGDVTMNIEVEDPVTDGVTSGIDKIEYIITNGTTGHIQKGTIDNPAKTSNFFNTSFDIDSTQFNSNDVKVVVYAYDNSSNKGDADTSVKIDITKPVISVVYQGSAPNKVGSTEYYNRNRTAVITVTERNFDSADVQYKIENTDRVVPILTKWTTNIDSVNPDNTTHTAQIEYTADGDYTFNFSFRDMAGNQADAVPEQKFTIDKTMPVISISYDNTHSVNGNEYYNAQRTATILVKEHNFDVNGVTVSVSATGSDNQTPATPPAVSAWSSSGGDTHYATVKFADDGLYSISVNSTDLALNKATPVDSGRFYIDKEAPTVDITGVDAEKAYAGAVRFEIAIDDINYAGDYDLSAQKVGIDGSREKVSSKLEITVSEDGKNIVCNSIAEEETNDGIYILSVSARDKAGNATPKDLRFSVNRYGSSYMLDEETEKLINQCIREEKDIVIKEINVDPIEVDSVEVICGSDTKVLTKDEDFTFEIEEGSPERWYSAVYTIKAKNFEQQGAYTIRLASNDTKLGVTNKNTENDGRSEETKPKLAISFVLDKSAPLVMLSGIEDDFLYEEASRTVTIQCDDINLKGGTLEVKINGKKYEYKPEDVIETASGIKLNVSLSSSDYPDYIDLEVSVIDEADNVGTAIKKHFKLSASWIERFFSDTVLVVAVFGGMAVVSGVIIFVFARRRRRRQS